MDFPELGLDYDFTYCDEFRIGPRRDRTEPPKVGRLVLDIQFDRWDERCVIRCSKLEVVDAESTGV